MLKEQDWTWTLLTRLTTCNEASSAFQSCYFFGASKLPILWSQSQPLSPACCMWSQAFETKCVPERIVKSGTNMCKLLPLLACLQISRISFESWTCRASQRNEKNMCCGLSIAVLDLDKKLPVASLSVLAFVPHSKPGYAKFEGNDFSCIGRLCFKWVWLLGCWWSPCSGLDAPLASHLLHTRRSSFRILNLQTANGKCAEFIRIPSVDFLRWRELTLPNWHSSGSDLFLNTLLSYACISCIV